MSSPFEPPPNIDCPQCHGEGYRCTPKGEYAAAEKCLCIPTCPRCNGVGYLTVLEGGEMRSGRCRCQKLGDRIQLFNRCRIPARHGEDSFRNFKHHNKSATIALSTIGSWIQSFGAEEEERGLILHGEVGRGKTHLLISICKLLMFEYGKSVRFVEFSRLLGMLREGYSRGQSDSRILEPLIEVDVLAIDELGKGRLTDWEMQVIDEIISRRYNSMKTIIGTTNYPWKVATGAPPSNLAISAFDQTLADRIGVRPFSRLQEMCFCYELKGGDFRSMRRQRL